MVSVEYSVHCITIVTQIVRFPISRAYNPSFGNNHLEMHPQTQIKGPSACHTVHITCARTNADIFILMKMAKHIWCQDLFSIHKHTHRTHFIIPRRIHKRVSESQNEWFFVFSFLFVWNDCVAIEKCIRKWNAKRRERGTREKNRNVKSICSVETNWNRNVDGFSGSCVCMCMPRVRIIFFSAHDAPT